MHPLAAALALLASGPFDADGAAAALAESIAKERAVADDAARANATPAADAPPHDGVAARGDGARGDGARGDGAAVHGDGEGPACPDGDAPALLEEMAEGTSTETLTVHEGWAALVIEQKLLNVPHGPGFRTDGVELPAGAGVVDGAFVAENEGPFRPAALEDAGVAEMQFAEYKRVLEMGVPPEQAKAGRDRAAVLVADDGAGVSIDVAAACSVRIVTVRIEARLTSLPVDGAWRFEVPRAAPSLTIDGALPMRVSVDGAAWHPRVLSMFPAPGGEAAGDALVADPFAVVDVRPLTGPKLRARGYATVVDPLPPRPTEANDAAPVTTEGDAPAGAVVARAELDLPRPLSDAPAGLRLVFVVDASVSVGTAALAKEWQMLDGILDAAPPDAKYAVVAAARKPRVVVGPWRDRRDRDRPAVALGNGSDVVTALARARGIASDVEEGQVARVVVLSDMKLPYAVDDDHLVRAFAGAPLTHVVVTADNADIEQSIAWRRSFVDEDARARGPESTGGIWVETGFGPDDEAALYPHLIHPTRIDLPQVTLAGDDLLAEGVTACVIERSPRDAAEVENQDDGLPMFLVGGSGLRVEAARPLAANDARARRAAVRGLRVQGLLWATPFRERVRQDASLLGVAAVDAVGAALDDDLVRSVATRAHAVSRTTSFVDIPAWRPATVDLGGFGISGCGCSCGCSCLGYGASSRCGVGTGVDLHERETLERLLAADARACLVPRAALDVEIGDLEILRVDVATGGACVRERFWEHRLDLLVVGRDRDPGAFVGHDTFNVAADARDR